MNQTAAGTSTPLRPRSGQRSPLLHDFFDHPDLFQGFARIRASVLSSPNRLATRSKSGESDLTTLRQVTRFAARYREGDVFILDADPTRGLELPSEPNPRRPVADDATVAKLLKAADRVRDGHAEKPEEKVRPPLREMIVLAVHTGRRIGAIVRLRWSDWFPEEATYGVLRWRADAGKLGRE